MSEWSQMSMEEKLNQVEKDRPIILKYVERFLKRIIGVLTWNGKHNWISDKLISVENYLSHLDYKIRKKSGKNTLYFY